MQDWCLVVSVGVYGCAVDREILDEAEMQGKMWHGFFGGVVELILAVNEDVKSRPVHNLRSPKRKFNTR